MTVKVFKSTLTWRTLDYQDQVLAPVVPGWPGIPVFIDEVQFVDLIRPTTRKGIVKLYMSSLAVLARNENDFKERMAALLKRKIHIIAIEDKTDWDSKSNLSAAVKAWRIARTIDAGKRGGVISAAKRKSVSEIAAKAIKERWRQPSAYYPTKVLLEEVNISLNTAKSILGNRPIAQANYRAAMKRKASSNAKYPRMKRAPGYIDEPYTKERPRNER